MGLLRKFVEGIVFGGGFGISFIAVSYVAAYVFMPMTITSRSDRLPLIREGTFPSLGLTIRSRRPP